MARRGGGATGFAVALVIITVFFVATLVTTILLMTERTDLRSRAIQSEQELRKFVRSTEERQPWVIQYANNADSTSVVRQMQDEIGRLLTIIIGDTDATGESIKNELKDTISKLEEIGIEEGDPLVQVVERLQLNFNKQNADIDQYKQQLDSERQVVVKVKADSAEKTANYEQAKQKAEADLTSLQTEYDRFKKSVADEYKKLEDRLQAVQQARQEENNDSQSKIETLQSEIETLRKRIRDLMQPPDLPRINAPDPSRQPDGEIVTVLNDQKLVYLNRGSVHRMILGLTFQVYDRRSGVVPDEFGDLSGKATIEVVSLSQNSSVARIVRTKRDSSVVPGDIVANAVYDPDKIFKFYVAGDFDIDGIGRTSGDDLRRIESMVRQWGGRARLRVENFTEEQATRAQRTEFQNLITAADTALRDGTMDEAREILEQGLARITKAEQDRFRSTLSYDIDFLVLGIEPEAPEKPDDTASDELIELYRRKALKYNIYKALEQEAKDLGIPVLNQNRFLGLVGYYRR